MYPRDLGDRLRERLDPRPDVTAAPGDRLAAVLIPMIGEDEVSLVFTQRTDELPRHAGEISFPGGMQDPSDATLADTALRETQEELGIAPAAIDVLGATETVHTFVSRILVVPFAGWLATRPSMHPDPGEIAEVLEFPISALVEAEASVEWQLSDGHVYRGWAYEVDGRTIWGATAAILHTFLALVRAASG
ncbi:MAG: CoA pyrophosphatase [Actinomycetota bacterium]